MNFKRKWLFFVLPLIMLSAALGWVKWKRDHPTPTTLDLAIRQRLLSAQEANLYHRGKFFYILSPAERVEIADHIWILDTDNQSVSRSNDDVILKWGTPSQSEVIYLQNSRNNDIYNYSSKKIMIGFDRIVHPATRRFLRQWMEQQPAISKQLK